MFVCVCVHGGGGGGQSQGGEPRSVCVKTTASGGGGGECVKGPCPCVLHTLAKASAGAWLTDERGARG